MSDAAGLQRSAPAKVNLRLRILAREASGFHQIETIFCAIDLADRIAVQPVDRGLHLHVVGADLGEPRDNLVWRAAEAFFRAAGIPAAARIRLEKRIPTGAGLGGGSSDAASTLHALNALHDRPLAEERLLELAAGIGSDVPFFASGRALALAWGRGGRLLPLPPLPSAPVLVGVPDFAIATADAYRDLARWRAQRPDTAPPFVLDPSAFASWDGIAAIAANDFEAMVFREHPVLARAVHALAESGALFSRLSGSGSAVFAVYEDDGARNAAAAQLGTAFPRFRWIPCRTAAGPAARAGTSLI